MTPREPRAMTTSSRKLERWDAIRARDRQALANLRMVGRREVGRLLRAEQHRSP